MLQQNLQKIWESRSVAAVLLLPLSGLFCLLVWLRRYAYRKRVFSSTRISVPVIVVGNITTGGTGKTPLVIAVVNILKQAGFNPGIISRGYGGKASSWPQQVRPDADPVMVGDEPVIIARRTGCPMAVGPNRVEAVRALLTHHDCDIVVSDDGLQHYALERDVEVVVVDGMRRFGNGWCLPAGPLREPVARLDEADLIVSNGSPVGDEYPMDYAGREWVHVHDNTRSATMQQFTGQRVHAIAGVGNPQRFFNMLRDEGMDVIEHTYPDHHAFVRSDFEFEESLPILMTEKDAVKCERLALENAWYVPIQAQIGKKFDFHLLNILEAKRGQKTA
ncbi:MAG: tetraacyldisaccharide 4'-kinase [Thiohalophilus sp.]|uniref:tetraacyldisaccharide 4'-kinase n=1 Tax=Thiohalophilus sp. TaxID=3028392 RepID=UPI00286FF68A|nr:tetraacyldisaccharide 4'-kinase [Thiohalophilus sp.]MDR9435542.1 tetraacyldisaccharide 4'-kinase [Thiohalophilus sp.]